MTQLAQIKRPVATIRNAQRAGVVVVLPILNEIENIAPLLAGIRKQLIDRPYTICIIDDGSTDGTREFLREETARCDDLHIITRTKTGRGSQRGSALRAGMVWGALHTTHEIFIELDGDLSHRTEELPIGIELIESGACDVAIASKYQTGSAVVRRPLGRRMVSQVCSLAVGLVIDSRVEDYSNGYRFYSRRAAETAARHGYRYGSPIYLTEVLALWMNSGLRVREFASTYIGRNEGLSKLRIVDLFKAGLAVFEVGLRYHLLGFRNWMTPDNAIRGDALPGPAACEQATRSERVGRRVTGWSVGLTAALVLALGVLCALFSDKTPQFDEVGLHNPAYTFEVYGKTTYPAHWQYDSMTVHPPLHYAELGLLMRTGLNLFHAAGVPLVLFLAVIIFFAVRGRFPPAVKLGLIFSALAATFLWNSRVPVRPDMHLALAWLAGLVVLENARLDDWNARKLGLGALLLSYASGVHYVGIAACSGIAVYVIWSLVALGPRRAAARIGIMAAGGALFWIPYALIFVWPHWQEIRAITNTVQGDGGARDALRLYWENYAAWSSSVCRAMFPPITYAISDPLVRNMIPLAIVGPALLLLLRSTRGLALAALPQILFIIFVSRGGVKGNGHTLYFIPEFMIYFAGFASVLGMTLFGVTRFVTRGRAPWLAAPIAAAAVGAACIYDVSQDDVGFAPGIADLEIARAAGRELLGPDAAVGMNSAAVWYTCGATYQYCVRNEALYAKQPPNDDARAYLSHFDAIALEPHDAHLTWNAKRQALSSWYADGTLNLRGFYFGERRNWFECIISYLLVAPERHGPLAGFGYRHGRLWRFDEAPDGDQLFVAVECPADKLMNNELQLDFAATIQLPNAEADARPSTRVLRVMVIEKSRFDAMRSSFPETYRVRDAVAGILRPVDADAALARLRREDQPIRFCRGLSELPPRAGKTVAVRAVDNAAD